MHAVRRLIALPLAVLGATAVLFVLEHLVA